MLRSFVEFVVGLMPEGGTCCERSDDWAGSAVGAPEDQPRTYSSVNR